MKTSQEKYNCQTHPWKIHHLYAFLWAFIANDPNKGHEQPRSLTSSAGWGAVSMILKLALRPLFPLLFYCWQAKLKEALAFLGARAARVRAHHSKKAK